MSARRVHRKTHFSTVDWAAFCERPSTNDGRALMGRWRLSHESAAAHGRHGDTTPLLSQYPECERASGSSCLRRRAFFTVQLRRRPLAPLRSFHLFRRSNRSIFAGRKMQFTRLLRFERAHSSRARLTMNKAALKDSEASQCAAQQRSALNK